jgi:phosphatidylglycerophosphatase A
MTRRHPVAWTLATWFGCGRVPIAPGTAGTVGAIPVYLLAFRAGGAAGVALAAVVVLAAGVWASSVVARDVGQKDPSIVVIDEVAGFLVTMAPMQTLSWRAVVVGFVLFRLLDSLKPWPIRRLEALPSGWGIVLDDIGAGALGAGLLLAGHAAFPFVL